MPNKTISLPDDVVPVIETLGMPFSRWVTQQLRHHAAQSTMSFGEQLLADAALADQARVAPAPVDGDGRPDRVATGQRMERSAPW
ncbi:MAG: hypothetical protein AAF567_13495 [Actinomycetota bacterium]